MGSIIKRTADWESEGTDSEADSAGVRGTFNQRSYNEGAADFSLPVPEEVDHGARETLADLVLFKLRIPSMKVT